MKQGDKEPLWQRSKGRQYLPRTVTVLGELGAMVLRNPQTGHWYAINYKPNRIVCASSEGRAMFILQPVVETTTKKPSKHRTQALKAAKLHERFVHRAADAFYNCVVPAFRTPRYCGELMVIEYYCEKDLELGDAEDDDEDDERPTLWEHYFEEPGVAPAPAELWQVGKHQYLIPPGPWRVSDRGIEFHKAN